MSLFEDSPLAQTSAAAQSGRPLAERMRPETLEEFAGQTHLLGAGKPLRRQMEQDQLTSIILWGPPGSGKTTLARLLAKATRSDFVQFSAVLGGTKEIKAVMADAERQRRSGRRTLLFVDEIHRFNKAQQDAFLPYVERGDITLVGATTENPSFEVISALLSRARVYALEALSVADVVSLLQRALRDESRGLGLLRLQADEECLEQMAVFASGDARAAYNLLELSGITVGEGGRITTTVLEDVLQHRTLLYDKSGEEHFNLISALHKSVRSSDADAALYWLGRMLEGGEDRLYLARRLMRMAIEDIGMAQPAALEQAVAAQQCVQFLGIPEGDLALAQLTIYLSLAPKSDASYRALGAVLKEVRGNVTPPVPLHLRNAPTRAMKEWGYGRGYEHAHGFADAVPGMECLPESLHGRRFYEPSDRGAEARLRERMEAIRELREKQKREPGDAGPTA